MSQLPQKLILVVEDDESIRESVVELLESENYHVAAATNGQEALDYLRSAPVLPNLVLLDLMMPVKDGFEFRTEMLADSRFDCVPVIVMSADGHMQEKKLRSSAREYLKKPVDIDDLLRAVSHHIT